MGFGLVSEWVDLALGGVAGAGDNGGEGRRAENWGNRFARGAAGSSGGLFSFGSVSNPFEDMPELDYGEDVAKDAIGCDAKCGAERDGHLKEGGGNWGREGEGEEYCNSGLEQEKKSRHIANDAKELLELKSSKTRASKATDATRRGKFEKLVPVDVEPERPPVSHSSFPFRRDGIFYRSQAYMCVCIQ